MYGSEALRDTDHNHAVCAQPLLPLCVDLDGTLIKSDLLIESILAVVRQNCFALLLLPYWLFKGRARLKSELALRAEVTAEQLPYNRLLLGHLIEQKQLGRRLILVTASNRKFAEQVAAHLNLFDAVYASDERVNLKGDNKARLLDEVFGRGNFDYAGNSHADVPVWRVARAAVIVNPEAGVESAARRVIGDAFLIDDRSAVARSVVKGMRVHQWLKNFLILVPLLAAQQFTFAAAASALLAFIAFSTCASSVYIVNDLLDLPADRAHVRKRNRPFASGALSPLSGIGMATILLAACILISLTLPLRFGLIMAAYFGITSAYSVYLKRIVLIDVVILAGLYTLRVIAGAAAISVEPSFWLLAFSMFIFLSLALLKRSAELYSQIKSNKVHTEGRGYRTVDHEFLHSMGVASGYLAVLVVAFYINNPGSMGGTVGSYSHPKVLWLLCPLLLYWISRMWLKAGRGEMHDDPLVFAALDPVSQKVFGLCLLAVLIAI